jgi:FtsP/CotA-like multicopper oxidase with cupredoxin domain
VANPVLFQWDYNSAGDFYYGTLEMGEAVFTINGESLTTRAYRQEGGQYSIPGPTMVMDPGKKYVLSFKNTLPYEAPSLDHNVFKDPNVTNLHTHGVHISGESPGDDVTRVIEGGWAGDYVYDIPANHMGGTFWYHAHHHGSTYLQVSSGAFGLIVIDDEFDNIPAHVADMQEQHIALGFLEPGNAAGTGGDSLISGTFSAGWTANGTVNGAVCLPPDTWQHWRMLVADQDARLVDLEIGAGCEVALMARDGVWRNEVPKLLTDNSLTLTGASRADLAVRCSSDSTISVAGNQVATIYVDGATDPDPHPYAADGESPWPSERHGYLRDLRGVGTVDGTATIRMGARTVLGSKFDAEDPNLTRDANGIQEWSINGATNHPFHLHIYHVQVQADCGPYEAGEYYDVIAGNCDVRFDMSPAEAYEGRTIFHCHILQHEDQGAMGWMKVIGGREPPTFPGDGVFMAHYQIDVADPPLAPSGLTATAVSSSQIDLAWTHNSSDETGFDIQRSLTGATADFNWLASVGEDVTSYSDMGLAQATQYFYQVAATNGGGSSAYSNVASDTTQSPGTGTQLEVGSIVVLTENAGKGLRFGRADIVVVDDLGNMVAGALVSGQFTGDITEDVTEAETGADGSVTAITSQSVKRLRNLTFCVILVEDPNVNLADFSGNVCSSL